MSGYKYTATFTFEKADPAAASFDDLTVLAEVERAMLAEFGPVRAVLVEVNGGDR